MRDVAGQRGLDVQPVLWVHHWTTELFSFRIARPPSFRFSSGEFVMIGLLDGEGRAVLRAYSIASPNWEDYLEFFSVKAPGGALTSQLQHLEWATRSSSAESQREPLWLMRSRRQHG